MVTWNKTKIVTTLGPASSSKKVLMEMFKNGADVVRINGAHGSFEEHKKLIKNVRQICTKMKLPIAILFDLPGPKLRLGVLKQEKIILKKGQKIILSCGSKVQTDVKIPVPEFLICKAITKGSKIFINDGIVELKVLSILDNNVECVVMSGGEIRSKKGINLPNAKLNIPSLTKFDSKLLKFAIKNHIDYVGLSFVRTAKNILDLRKILEKNSSKTGIIAKIEKPEALDNLDDIIEASDAIMIARGDLGIEMPFNQLPVIQRKILGRCAKFGKPVITATQMMESMVQNSRPTRAEATDVAEAVWQGTDAIMLSEETSVGIDPALTVKAMSSIVSEAEKYIDSFTSPDRKSNFREASTQLISVASSIIAEEIKASAIVTPTRRGKTALFISKTRPPTQIIAPTTDEVVYRKMNLYWGVRPMIMPKISSLTTLLLHAKKLALKSGYINKGDTIIITSGAHNKKKDTTRILEIRRL